MLLVTINLPSRSAAMREYPGRRPDATASSYALFTSCMSGVVLDGFRRLVFCDQHFLSQYMSIRRSNREDFDGFYIRACNDKRLHI